jgi:hypothetical protein
MDEILGIHTSATVCTADLVVRMHRSSRFLRHHIGLMAA